MVPYFIELMSELFDSTVWYKLDTSTNPLIGLWSRWDAVVLEEILMTPLICAERLKSTG